MKEEIEALIGMAEELGAKGNEINFMKGDWKVTIKVERV